MTRDDIIRMAKEAGAIESGDPQEWDVWLFQDPAMERFAALVAAEKDKEIAEIKRERRRDMAEICSLRESEESLREEVERLRSELAALRTDAKRYRWVCDHASAIDLAADPDNFVNVWVGTDPAQVFRGRTLDDAVGEAMKEAALRREGK